MDFVSPEFHVGVYVNLMTLFSCSRMRDVTHALALRSAFGIRDSKEVLTELKYFMLNHSLYSLPLNYL